jgi:hypothetical protein
MVAAMHADKERAEAPLRRAPATDDHFVARPTFSLCPPPATAGRIRCVESLRHDTFKTSLAGRFQHRVAIGREMLDIAQPRPAIAVGFQQFLEPFLA